MTLTIEIAPETERQLRQRAAAQGKNLSDFVLEVVEDAAASDTRVDSKQAKGYGLFADCGPTPDQRHQWREEDLELERTPAKLSAWG